jgi:hypothetical protein
LRKENKRTPWAQRLNEMINDADVGLPCGRVDDVRGSW